MSAESDLRRELDILLSRFDLLLLDSDVRKKVQALVPAYAKLQQLGASLCDPALRCSARDRVLRYLLAYPLTPIDGDELMVVSGIAEWGRRVRELRVEFGYRILNGITLRAMIDEGEVESKQLEPTKLSISNYVLVDTEQDREAAHRWRSANRIRRTEASVRDKLLHFLRENAGHPVAGEELRYVAGDESTEWARRVRELRTEFGWPVYTNKSGRPDLSSGMYVLDADRQAAVHDRRIPDVVRVQVLQRDGHQCVRCGWNRKMLTIGDPRQFLELHHLVQHIRGGTQEPANLVTVCNICHDNEHR